MRELGSETTNGKGRLQKAGDSGGSLGTREGVKDTLGGV